MKKATAVHTKCHCIIDNAVTSENRYNRCLSVLHFDYLQKIIFSRHRTCSLVLMARNNVRKNMTVSNIMTAMKAGVVDLGLRELLKVVTTALQPSSGVKLKGD